MQKSNKKIISVIAAVVTVAVVLVFSFAILPSDTAYAETSRTRVIYYGVPTFGQPVQTRATEVINYTSKVTEEDYINATFPEYYNTNGNLTNTCAPVAGAMIVGYYDRTYTDLIANFTPGR
ncbi:MAG: hypothetical protein EOM87_09885, partial [Clostridia bacterium]|nr:hypothetical protein [Clostridia bacterium]